MLLRCSVQGRAVLAAALAPGRAVMPRCADIARADSRTPATGDPAGAPRLRRAKPVFCLVARPKRAKPRILADHRAKLALCHGLLVHLRHLRYYALPESSSLLSAAPQFIRWRLTVSVCRASSSVCR